MIGLILASAFPAIVVFAQELMPHRIGIVSGLFFGLAFGMGGLGAALLGVLADATSVQFVYKACAFLPLIGVLAAFLPEARTRPPARPDRAPAQQRARMCHRAPLIGAVADRAPRSTSAAPCATAPPCRRGR